MVKTGSIAGGLNTAEKKSEGRDSARSASVGSSLKTSIDDETVMELAKEGIKASTPVQAKVAKTSGSFDQIKQIYVTPAETPESHR